MKRVKEQINAKSGFKDLTVIKEQRELDKPVDGKKSPFDFRCPQYDQRSGNFVNAGTHYGVGHRQPVGHTGNPKMHVDTLPVNRKAVKTTRDDEKG